jgi:hypothetical protein
MIVGALFLGRYGLILTIAGSRTLRIVYDPSTLPDGRKRSASGGLTLASRPPMIYSAWLLTWLWLLTAGGLAVLALCIALASGAAG